MLNYLNGPSSQFITLKKNHIQYTKFRVCLFLGVGLVVCFLAYLSGVEIADVPAVAGDHQLHGKDEKEDDGSLVTVPSPHQSRAEGRH